MKAALVRRYGPPGVVEIGEVADPEVGPGEVRVRVRAAGVSSGDVRVRGFLIPRVSFWLPARLALGVLRPRRAVLGTDFAGEVESVGAGVTRWAVGDRVFGVVPFDEPVGTHAELVTVKAEGLIERMPEGMGFEEAGSAGFGISTARDFLLQRSGLREGQRVLVLGASGAVGCAAVQVAKHAGAHVTGVCSGANAELVRSLGADDVIDYTREDFTKLRGEGYDLVFDTVGASTIGRCSGVLKADGAYVALVMGLSEVVTALWRSVRGGPRLVLGVTKERAEDLAAVRELHELGAYRVVVDSVFPLERITEAHERVQTWRKRGNVVVTMGG